MIKNNTKTPAFLAENDLKFINDVIYYLKIHMEKSNDTNATLQNSH